MCHCEPFVFVILTPYQVRGENLIILLRINSVKVDTTHVASLLAMTTFQGRSL